MISEAELSDLAVAYVRNIPWESRLFNMATPSFEIVLSSHIKVPSKSVTYNVLIIELFHPFRNHNIHTMLVWDSATIAVKNVFFCLMQFPIMVEHKKLSGFPA